MIVLIIIVLFLLFLCFIFGTLKDPTRKEISDEEQMAYLAQWKKKERWIRKNKERKNNGQD